MKTIIQKANNHSVSELGWLRCRHSFSFLRYFNLYIHKNAAIPLGKMKTGETVQYRAIFCENGFYLFVLDGSIKLNEEVLSKRNAVGVYDIDEIGFNTSSDTNFFLSKFR